MARNDNTMILINNRQRKININVAQLKKDTKTVLDELGYSDFDIGILLTTNQSIRKLNCNYRNKDKATDILSFPFHPDVHAGERIIVQTDDDKNLGDIIISLEYVQRDAKKLGVTLEQRMKRLLVHGICHLLNYDHIEDIDYEKMIKVEMALLNKIQ